MDELLADIVRQLKEDGTAFDARALDRLLARYNRAAGGPTRRYAKKALLPYYLRVKDEEPARWQAWGVDAQTEERLFALLRMKPRRTASGVATITVITKPWPCGGTCIYCPNDIRMPKSYLADEPACQRAERAFFDPYLQIHARLHTLNQMGHPTDKVEVIVLGGTWTDYPRPYRVWFMEQLFEALNDGDTEAARTKASARRARYEAAGIPSDRNKLAGRCRPWRAAIEAGELTYNEAFPHVYGEGTPWETVAQFQEAGFAELEAAQHANETAANRMVGLVVETRPDAVTPETAAELRRCGCTKVQIGIQSLDPHILQANGRAADPDMVARAIAVLRLFGFKIHIHFMANLYAATPEGDRADYRTLVTDPRFLPDEVKLYPCVLVGGTPLERLHADGKWQPYDEDTLVALLRDNALATPPYTRISRMIRDISAHDIKAGNKKTNLRQMVEGSVNAIAASEGDEGVTEGAGDGACEGMTTAPGDGHAALRLREIRAREIAGGEVDGDTLSLDDVVYDTAVSTEHFLQWVTPDDRIAGFLRLSLPKPGALAEFDISVADCSEASPVPSGYEDDAQPGVTHSAEAVSPALQEGGAMIREVHIYGRTARIHTRDDGVQHRGLGAQLIERACDIARAAGYERIYVISAVGTRGYYRKRGFSDNGLYQVRPL